MAENAKVLVAGYGETEFGLFIRVKNAVSRNKMLKAKATHNGVINVEKGFTMEEVKTAYPFATQIEGAKWGAPVTENGDGEEMKGVFEVEIV